LVSHSFPTRRSSDLGEDFCFKDKDDAKKGLAIAEQSSNFIAWKLQKGEGCWKLVNKGYDKKSSTLKAMLRKYSQIEDFLMDDFDVPDNASGRSIEELYPDEDLGSTPEGNLEGEGLEIDGDEYSWDYEGFGGTLTRLSDGKSVYLQGEEAADFDEKWDRSQGQSEQNDLGDMYGDVMEEDY
jgi:hypothetical protein